MKCSALAIAAVTVALGTIACSAGSHQPAVFDLQAARQRDNLLATEVPAGQRTIDGVTVREVRFTSLAWAEDGAARPIRLQALVAAPSGGPRRPAVIYAHGLGGHAEAHTAAELSRNLDVVALSLSGPGMGGSEGQGPSAADPTPLFAAARDLRHSWLYGYVYGLLRAITYLQTRPDVDPEAIVVTGFSLGGVATLIANGVDERIRGALPVAASGGLAQAAAADTWMRQLVLSAKGLRPEDPGPRALFGALDPLRYAARQHGAVFLLAGAQDEYFPLPQLIATYQALRAPRKGLALMADYDHGWYFGGGCPARCMPGATSPSGCPADCPHACPAGAAPPYCGPQASYNRHEDFSARWALLLRALVARYAARPPRPFLDPPPPPVVERKREEIVVRPGAPARAVRVAVSEDCGWTYAQEPLSAGAGGAYRWRRPLSPRAIVIAEVEGPEGAVATSVPSWPEQCTLRVRPFGPRP